MQTGRVFSTVIPVNVRLAEAPGTTSPFSSTTPERKRGEGLRAAGRGDPQLSRRLGDDPLSRQRKGNSKTRRVGGADLSSSGVPAAAPNHSLSTEPQHPPESITRGVFFHIGVTILQ